MKLIDYGKNRIKIYQKIQEYTYDPRLTCRDTIDQIMELLDGIPEAYTEDQIKEIDRAYHRVCKELEEIRRGAKEQKAVSYLTFYKMIADRIGGIQALLSQYPEAAACMSGRLDELNMMLEECKKMAADERRNDLSIK